MDLIVKQNIDITATAKGTTITSEIIESYYHKYIEDVIKPQINLISKELIEKYVNRFVDNNKYLQQILEC